MESTNQLQAPPLVGVGRIALLEEIGDQLDDAALPGSSGDGSAWTCDAATLTDRMCISGNLHRSIRVAVRRDCRSAPRRA